MNPPMQLFGTYFYEKGFNFGTLDELVSRKVATEIEGVLFWNTRMLESTEIKAVGHLADNINIEDFTGTNFKVPMLDFYSPLAKSIALHLHFVKYPHKGIESLHRLSLQFVNILKGKKIFEFIAQDCGYCAKLRGKLLQQSMGLLDNSQITISPVLPSSGPA